MSDGTLVWVLLFSSVTIPPPGEIVEHGSLGNQERSTIGSKHEDPPLDLPTLISLAETTSPRLKTAALDVEEARGRAKQAGLYPNPNLRGGAMQLGGHDSQYYAQLSQEIVTKHKLQLDQSAAIREVTQAEYRYQQVRFQLLTAVRVGYYQVLADQQRVRTLDDLVTIVTRSEAAARQLEQVGEGTRSDTLIFQVEYHKATLQRQNAETLLQAARKQLAATLGLAQLPFDAQVQGDLRVSLDVLNRYIDQEDYVPRNAILLEAEADVGRRQLLLQRAEVEPFPNITVTAGYLRQFIGTNHLTTLELSVPLPVWNQNQGNIYAAQTALNRAQQNVEQVRNELARELADLRGRFRAAQQQVQRYEESLLPLAKEGVEIIQKAFAQGQFDFLRLLQSQRVLVETQLGYLQALEERWNAAARIAGMIQLDPFP